MKGSQTVAAPIRSSQDSTGTGDALAKPSRAERIAEYRQRQPIEELERKWRKAQGRWSNQYWSAEWLDLAEARSRQIRF